MKLTKMKLIWMMLISMLFIFCENDKYTNRKSIFNESFKELKKKDPKVAMLEYMDTVHNLYSNFKYGVAFDGPNHWDFNYGASERNIFSTFQIDSAVVFDIIVVDINVEKTRQIDLWKQYNNNKEKTREVFSNSIKLNINSEFVLSNPSKRFIKNSTAIRWEIDYVTKDLDYEYDRKMIMYQTFRNGNNYTFTLALPLVFYEGNESYYEELFSRIQWLKNQDEVNQYLDKILSN